MMQRILHFIRSTVRQSSIEQFAKITPINLFLLPKFNRYNAMKIFIAIFVFLPFFGYFRLAYMRYHFWQMLKTTSENKQIELKESLLKFDLKIPEEMEYLVVVSIMRGGRAEGDSLSQEEEEICRKLYQSYIDGAEGKQSSTDIKWVFIGDRNIYSLIQKTYEQQENKKFNIQFHEESVTSKQGMMEGPSRGNISKVYLVGRNPQDEEEEQVVSEWDAGQVQFDLISKSMAKHRYKKFIRSVDF